MAKNVCWLAACVKENDLYYCYGIPVKPGTNLLSTLAAHKNLICAHPCSTRRECREIVEMWNAVYKEQNKYMFAGGETF